MNPKLFESLENRLHFAFGQPDNNFGVAGRAVTSFSGASKTPAVQQVLVVSGGKILAGGTTGLAQYTSAGAKDSGFGTSGKVTFPNAATFIAEGVDSSNGNIYVLVSAPSGTGIFRYNSAGKLDTSFGSGGTATVTTSKSFIPQSLVVQSDGKPIVAGVVKTDSSNGRKVRIYRLKADGTGGDTGFDSDGIQDFNLGQSNFLGNTIYDKVAAVKLVGGGKIDVIGGSVNYTPGGTDPDSGDFIETSYDKAVFAVARLTTAGALDGSYVAGGISRDTYANSDDLASFGIDDVLPRGAATRGDDSVVVAGFANNRAVVAEFGADSSVKYTATAGNGLNVLAPRALTTLSDGRSVLLTNDATAPAGYSMVAIDSNGNFGNVVNTDDGDDATTDIADLFIGGALATASNGEILAGGGDGEGNFVVQEFKQGNANDARPDEFADARANDIVKDAIGGLHVTYFNAATKHLMYAHRNPNGLWDPTVTVDSGTNAGQYVSIDVNSKNNPGIAYFDGNAGDLKLATFNGTSWKLEKVDSKGSVGLYPSFQFDNADEAVVTYFNKTKGLLTFALKKANVTWGYENVDGSGHNVGRSSVLVASPKTNRYAVAYVDNTTGSVMWAGHKKGGTWDVKVAAKTKGGADFLSMSYGYYYEPMIAYYDAFAADLKITTFYNNQFNVKPLATSQAQGLYTAAFFGAYFGTGQVFAYNRSQDKVTFFKNVLDSNITTEDVVTGGGKFLSVDSNGGTTDLAYYDAAAGKLKIRPGPSLA